MTPEEIQQLEEALKEESPKEESKTMSKKDIEALEIEMGAHGKPEPEKASSFESFAAGMSEGMTMGFDSELKAGIDTLYGSAISLGAQHLMGTAPRDMTLSGMGELYDERLKQYDKEMKKTQQDHPNWFMGGDMVGSGVSFLYGGGQASLAKTMAISAVHGYGRSDEVKLGDKVQDAAISGALGLGGDLMGRGLGAGLKSIKKMKGWSILEAIGVNNAPSKRVLRSHLAKTGRNVDEFAEGLAKMDIHKAVELDGKVLKIKEPLFRMQQTFDETLDKVIRETGNVGDDIGHILQKADDTLGTDIQASELYTHLKREVVDTLAASEEPTKQKLAVQVQNYLDSMFRETVPETIIESVPKKIPTGVYGADGAPAFKTVMETTTKEVNKSKWKKNFDLKGLQNLKNDVYDVIKDTAGYLKTDKMSVARDVPAIDVQKQKIGSILNKKIDDIMENRLLDGAEYGAYKAAKTKYSDLLLARNWLFDQKDKINHGILGKLRDNIMARGLSSSMVGLGLYSAGVDPGTSAAVALSMIMALSSPGMPASLALGMRRVSNAIASNPERYAEVVSRISTSASVSSPSLMKALSYANGVVGLTERPLSRNTASLMERKDEVLSALDDHPLKENLRAAIDENNPGEVKLWMGEILQEGDFGRKYLESSNIPGVWDNTAVTPDAQQAVLGWAKKIRNVRKRKTIIENFQSSKQVPPEMMLGESGEPPPKQVIFKKMRNKLDKEY